MHEPITVAAYVRRLWPTAWLTIRLWGFLLAVAFACVAIAGKVVGSAAEIAMRLAVVVVLIVAMGFAASAFLDWRWKRLSDRASWK
jgi:hypothetical protein